MPNILGIDDHLQLVHFSLFTKRRHFDQALLSNEQEQMISSNHNEHDQLFERSSRAVMVSRDQRVAREELNEGGRGGRSTGG